MAAFVLTPEKDNFLGRADEDNIFFLTPETLQANDTITGAAAGLFVDSIQLTASGAVAASQFAGVTNIELIGLSAGGNSVSLTNGLIAGTSIGVFALLDGAGDDTVDASGITNGIRIAFFASTGNDTFIGGNGNDYFQFNTADLTSADTVVGGTGYDVLAIGTGGTVTADAFAGVTGIEALILSDSGNAVTLTNALVAGSSTGIFVVSDGAGDDAVDAGGVTNGTRIVAFASVGDDAFIGGNGNDYFQFNAADLTSADTVTGGVGFDVLAFATGGAVAASAFTHVTGIEELLLNDAGNNVTLTNGLVAGSTLDRFVITDGAGNDTVDASAVTNGKGIAVLATTGADTFIGTGASDYFQFTAADLTSADTVTAGAGFDSLALTTGGTVAASAFTNVTGIDVLILSSAGNNVTLTNGLVASASPFVVIDGAGDDTVDVGGVTNGVRVIFEGSGGNDTFNGGNGSDFFQFAATDLTSGDTLTGGAGFDILDISTPGTVASSAFAHVSGIDELILNNGTNTVTLNNQVVANSDNGVLVVFDGTGNDTVDGSAVTGGRIVFEAASGNDSFTGGAGADFFMFAAGDLTSADTVVGGAGTDTLQITTNGTVSAANLAGVSEIEVVQLSAGGSITLTDNLSTGALTGIGSAAADTFDGAGVTHDLTLQGNGGADVLKGGSGNDKFLIPDSSFTQIDGGAGTNQLVLTGANQTFDLSANASKIANIEVLSLDNTANNNTVVTLTGDDIPVISATSKTLYVVGSGDDQVDVGDGWTLIATGVVNNAIAPGYTFNQWQHTNGSTLFLSDQITMAVLEPDQPPVIELGGDPIHLNFSTSYTTGDLAGAAVGATGAVIADPDPIGINSEIVTLTATVADPHSGSAEFLDFSAAGLAILGAHPELAVSGEGTTGLRVSGADPASVYESLLRDIRYVNTDVSQALDTTPRRVTIDVQDGAGTAAVERTATITLLNGGAANAGTDHLTDAVASTIHVSDFHFF